MSARIGTRHNPGLHAYREPDGSITVQRVPEPVAKVDRFLEIYSGKMAALGEHDARLVRAVYAHAIEHYDEGGWDVVVECWEPADVLESIADAGDDGGTDGVTPLVAIRTVAHVVSAYADRQADARNSAF